MKKYNTSALDVEGLLERNLFHRDALAHLFRYAHVLKLFKRGQSILDLGCGSGHLYEMLYRNRMNPRYIGIDIRKKQIQKNREKFPKANWLVKDLVEDSLQEVQNEPWDYIVCFEVVEHIGKKNVPQVLRRIRSLAHEKTIILISTPNHDPTKKTPNHHIVDGEVGEFEHQEFESLLVSGGFCIEKKFGTFISQRDYVKNLNPVERKFFEQMKEYFDSTSLSIFFAPLFPKRARNCLWRLRIKK